MATFNTDNQLVYTVKNMCKVCYTCVRECPVKAIRIINGQAEVIPERCIACGNCVRVCSQGAKVFVRSNKEVFDLLREDKKSVACLAPSFPAEFDDINDYRELVGMIRKLGFDLVVEVSFGADLVAAEYKRVFDKEDMQPHITSDCPAVVNYIEHYHPDLVKYLAPIASPAMAVAEVVKMKYGDNLNIVFIGPCIAKKAESDSFTQNLTFTELREMFKEADIRPDPECIMDFDAPYSGKGAIFPVNHGLIQTIDRNEGFGRGEVITAEGRSKVIEAVKNFEQGLLKDQHLELLCCDGCIQGPGMTQRGLPFIKRKCISEYVKQKVERLDTKEWDKQVELYKGVGLGRTFVPSDQRIQEPSEEEIKKVLLSMGREDESDMLNCGACGYETCHEHAIAVAKGLAEAEMCLPYAIEKLHQSVQELNTSNKKLADTRQALKQSEKLASMGQVSAGIAHELNNPLGIITLYSSILRDEVEKDSQVYDDIAIIDEQAARCKKIVGGLLNFARKNQVILERCDIVEFIGHSFKSVIIPKGIELQFEHNIADPVINIDTDQIMQVLTNLFRNAVEAMGDRGVLRVTLEEENENIIIVIKDTGSGISEKNLEKIFTPFFTTKDAGKGTGLGLPLAYGIVKMHKGKINVVSNNKPEMGETGTIFTISLPANRN